jgi:hypothetical protein
MIPNTRFIESNNDEASNCIRTYNFLRAATFSIASGMECRPELICHNIQAQAEAWKAIYVNGARTTFDAKSDLSFLLSQTSRPKTLSAERM